MTSDAGAPSIVVEGNEFKWDVERGILEISGGASLAIWLESSLAGLMRGMQQMVGTERFNLALQAGGRESVDGDWGFIAGFPTAEEGFAKLSRLAFTCGWGLWSLESLDRAEQVARFRSKSSFEGIYQRALGVCWGSHYVAGKFAGITGRIFGAHCWANQVQFEAEGDPYDEFVVKPSDATIEGELERLLSTERATASDLAAALERLREENEIRRGAEREAQRRLALIESQQRDLELLSTPIMEIWDGVLSLPVVGALSGGRAQVIMDRLLSEIQRTNSRFALIDVTGVDTIDTATANSLLRIARSTRLLGAECVITGIRPAVAQTMINLDTTFAGVVTLANVRDGLKYCMQRLSGR
ncbi:MAG: STAS domain-containing protein [Nannocystaceae bacterium]